MIIKFDKTYSNSKSRFEIKVNDEIKYLAGMPWMDINIPGVKPYIITRADESICYTAVPVKWKYTGLQNHVFNIFDTENNIWGKFYELTTKEKYIIECEEFTLKCYDICVGKTRNVLIYKDDFQIAEILKPLNASAINYYLFLLDEYSELETILSFFTVWFDHRKTCSKENMDLQNGIAIQYSLNKNNYKFYDKNWIANNFNKEEVDLINNQILEDRKNASKNLKRAFFTTTLIMLIIFTAFGISFLSYYIQQK